MKFSQKLGKCDNIQYKIKIEEHRSINHDRSFNYC